MHKARMSFAHFRVEHADDTLLCVSFMTLVLTNDSLNLAEAGAAADAAKAEGRRPIEGDCPICFEDLQVRLNDRLHLQPS